MQKKGKKEKKPSTQVNHQDISNNFQFKMQSQGVETVETLILNNEDSLFVGNGNCIIFI